MDVPYDTTEGPIDLGNLRECDLMADKIADGLAKNNRFNGRTPVPWSVASHSVLVCDLCPWEIKAHGLLHDAHEFILGDFATPSVDFIVTRCGPNVGNAVPLYIALAKMDLDEQIGSAWDVSQMRPPAFPDPARHAEVKAADRIALEAEMFVFFGKEPACYGTPEEDMFERAVSLIHELPKDTAWRAARDLWLTRARHLASLGLLRLPANGKEPVRMMRPETAQEKTA